MHRIALALAVVGGLVGCAERAPAVVAPPPPPPTTVAALPDAAVAVPAAAPTVDAAVPTEVRAWFKLSTVKCRAESPGTCYRVTLALRGAVTDDRLVAKSYWSQTGCAAGKIVACSGPSGDSNLSVRCDAGGACVVEAFSESDGYCPTNDCGSTIVQDRFRVPAGTKVVFGKP